MHLLTNSVDAYVREDKPSANYGDGKRLRVQTDTGVSRQAFIRHSRSFPLGVQITDGNLTLVLRAAFVGTITFTLKRITSAWGEGKVTWDNRPTVSGTNTASVTVTDGQAGQELVFDCSPMLQDVSGGGAWHGVRLESDSATLAEFFASEATADGTNPTLEVEWTEAPEPPTDLAPSGQVTSLALPLLDWVFRDKVGATTQGSAQIQISTTSDFAVIEWDSDKVALEESVFDLAGSDYSGIPADETRFWRVKVWDTSDLASGWSDPAEVTYVTKGTLTLQSPLATAEETTPPISWTLADRTQEAYEVWLEVKRPETVRIPWGPPINRDIWRTLWTTGKVTSTDDSVTVPAGYVISKDETYRARVRVWDDKDRIRTATEHPYREVSQEFVFEASAVVTPVGVLTATNDGSPKVILEWTYSDTEPDYWSVVVDGKEVDQVDAHDLYVSGTTYRYQYWGASPRATLTYEVRAVRLDLGVEKHSDDNDTATLKTEPIGLWLICRAKDLWVAVMGKEKGNLSIGVAAATYNPKGRRRPVRITDAIRGYEGTLSGQIVAIFGRNAKQIRADYLEMVGLNNTETIRLIMADLNIPVEIEPGTLMPNPDGGEDRFDVSFSVAQVGNWPMEVKGLDD